MKKTDSQKRVELADNLIAEAILSAIESSPDLTYGEILAALCHVAKRYTEYLIRSESEVTQ